MVALIHIFKLYIQTRSYGTRIQIY